ncbi:MAG: DUF6285 domain-containing protein [Thermodesulfobacteriota bacterium]
MQDRPTIDELLEAVRRFLADEVVPATDGRRQFLARVAANALDLVRRELATEAAHAEREWRGLDALLGPEPMPRERAELAAAVRRRNQALCKRIRAGAYDAGSSERAALLAHVRATVHDKLEVTNRAYVDADAKRG